MSGACASVEPVEAERAHVTGRVSVAFPFLIIGTAHVIAGGMVAAVTARTATETASWAAAYLVLVAGVAQVMLGGGQAYVCDLLPGTRTLGAQLVMWNTGNAAVLVGVTETRGWLVNAGGVLLVATLALTARATRGSHVEPWALIAFRAFQVVLVASVPVGLLLATR